MTKNGWQVGVIIFYFWMVLPPWIAASEGASRPLQRGVVSTFSIVACDLKKRQWGVATQSRVLAVGSIVPFAQAEVGAVATQSWAHTSLGPEGLKMLNAGRTARETRDRCPVGAWRGSRRGTAPGASRRTRRTGS